MRKPKKYHYIYKTTNLLNGKYYYGMHSSDNLNDGYLGSGTYVKRALNKYGRENFKFEILEFCKTREELKSREIEIVNLQEIAKKECMNLKIGGEGGFKYSHNHQIYASRKLYEKLNTDSEFRKNQYKKISEAAKLRYNDGRERICFYDWTGKKHKEETKKKIGEANSKHQQGINNHQFGTRWITNGIENKKIYKGDEIPNGFNLGRCSPKQ